MKKLHLSLYLSGQIADDFDKYLERVNGESSGPAKVNISNTLRYLVEVGLKVENGKAANGSSDGLP